MFRFSDKLVRLIRNKSCKKFHTSTISNALKFTQEHDELRKTVNKIIDKDINPYVDQWEKADIYPAKEIFKKLGDAGLLGITRPTEYGGLGLDYSFSVAFFEELSNINCQGVPMSIIVHTDMATPALARFGSEELKQEFLVPSIAGDRVSCVAVSEVHCGSDVAAIKTKAERKGDDLIINGGKMWITNGAQADWMCLLANTREGPAHKNKSLICVPLDAPGITFNKINKLGTCSSDNVQFFFENVRVPAKNIIGEEGMGFIYQMLQFQDERLGGCVGAQMIDGQDVTKLASMAKLKAGRLTREVNDKCLQFWGGMGYTSDVLISRFFRDGRLLSIAGGSDEVMLSIISKYMGILPKPK
ncbi:unnamed protein product [Larinioides sclopetarius]|uniref:Acyl-CoA dehydrogenase n=1 Tax=Larinioides sclopetarius TaxID=280406 RepID=A0AAV2BUL4_9ARAC